MQDKISVLKKIDAAIEALDESTIEAGLRDLSEPDSIQAEDPRLFAARIQKLYREKNVMLKPVKSMRIAIVAAVVLLMGITAYAAGALNLFSFQQGDKFITFRTTESMTKQDAKDFVGENANISAPESNGTDMSEGVMRADTEDFTFDSAAQASETLEMDIPLPSAMPDMKLDSATGSAISFSDDAQSRTVWLTYSDDIGRMFGITVEREIIKPGSSVTGYTTHDIDDGSLGTYKSKSGADFTTLTESDDTGTKTAHIATAMIGEYEYSLVFFGFDEAERQAIIDSVDLSVYK